MKTIQRKPTSPGEILRHEFLEPLGISQRTLARHIGCDIKVINRIVNERSSLTAEIALKLAAAFETTPDFWLAAQKAIDIYKAAGTMRKLPAAFSRTRLHGTRAA